MEVGPSKVTVASTPPAEEAVKDSEQPSVQSPQQVSTDVSGPPSRPTVPVPAPVKEPPAGVAAVTRSRRQIKLPARFKDFSMT